MLGYCNYNVKSVTMQKSGRFLTMCLHMRISRLTIETDSQLIEQMLTSNNRHVARDIPYLVRCSRVGIYLHLHYGGFIMLTENKTVLPIVVRNKPIFIKEELFFPVIVWRAFCIYIEFVFLIFVENKGYSFLIKPNNH